jgi:hypothetical protein
LGWEYQANWLPWRGRFDVALWLVPPVIDNEWNVRIDGSATGWRIGFVAGKEIAVKKYVMKLTAAERERLETMISGGRDPAQRLTKARILLKADAEEAGEGWSDSQIAAALETSLATIARTRQQLVEEGFEAVLSRRHSLNSARKRIFDGAAEARLIALTRSEPPTGGARWTLSLLGDKVVELSIAPKPAITRLAGR